VSLTDRIPPRDHEVERDVRAELEVARSLTDPPFVRITVRDGVVYLTGSAASYAQKWAIERAASRVIGVKDVRDYVAVHPRTADALEDHDIARAARGALAWDARVPAGVRAAVTDGVLRLQGTADRPWQRDAAEEAVRNLLGIRDVVNEIRLAPDPAPATLEHDVAAALRRRLGAQAGGIALSAADGVVTLTGPVSTYAVLAEVLHTVRAVPGVARIVDQLLVA
jgi:osmotically-inducible protein OsmY